MPARHARPPRPPAPRHSHKPAPAGGDEEQAARARVHQRRRGRPHEEGRARGAAVHVRSRRTRPTRPKAAARSVLARALTTRGPHAPLPSIASRTRARRRAEPARLTRGGRGHPCPLSARGSLAASRPLKLVSRSRAHAAPAPRSFHCASEALSVTAADPPQTVCDREQLWGCNHVG